jgi:tetratricopeptide (TPR) repeat protein
MYRSILTILVLFSAHAYVCAQTPRAYEQAALAAFESRDYYAAFKYYGEVLRMEPTRTDMQVRYADAARLYGAYRDAERHYEIAMAAQLAGSNYHEALYGLALVKKNLGKYDEALRLFERYVARPDNDPDLRQKAVVEITDCEWAMEKVTNPDRLAELKPFEAEFNTSDSEMGMIAVGDTLYFSALRSVDWGDEHVPARPLLQVMMSVHGQSPVLAPFNVEKRHTALPAFSPDGKVMVVPVGTYTDETTVRCELFYALWQPTAKKWGVLSPLPATINVAAATMTQPQITRRDDGYYDLYYVSDAPNGKGGKDIWKVQFSANGLFAQPENLGQLNTEADEATPYFDAHQQALFFSSNGYQNLGGFDIYQSKIGKNGLWQAVKHLPVPINSSYNDLYYAPVETQHAASSRAWLTSNRIGGAADGEESCCYDLFSVQFKPLELDAQAFETYTKAPLDQVLFTLVPTSDEVVTRFSAATNRTDFKVKRANEYVLMAQKDGYYPDTVKVSTLQLEPQTIRLSERLHLRPKKVDLAVVVFNELSRERLSGVNVRLYEMSGKVHDEQTTQQEESALKADYQQGYMIIAQKPGFSPDTTTVSIEEMSKPGTKVIKNLFLTPETMYGLLPLAIYFDNNVPPRQPSTTIESYDITYQEYMNRREEFITTFTQHLLNDADKAIATDRINRFFDEQVKGGFTKLEYFAEHLDLFLNSDYEVEIMVKGFASPLASHDYNLALTKRRIVSVRNYLRKAKGGIYESFIQQNKLIVTNAPLGESQALPGINDSHRHLDQSVFSPEASKERRAEIIEVRLTRKK